jgi:hypothetical protein
LWVWQEKGLESIPGSKQDEAVIFIVLGEGEGDVAKGHPQGAMPFAFSQMHFALKGQSIAIGLVEGHVNYLVSDLKGSLTRKIIDVQQ